MSSLNRRENKSNNNRTMENTDEALVGNIRHQNYDVKSYILVKSSENGELIEAIPYSETDSVVPVCLVSKEHKNISFFKTDNFGSSPWEENEPNSVKNDVGDERAIKKSKDVASYWKQFSRESTWHGLKQIESQDRLKASRGMYLLFVFVLVISCGVFIVQLTSKALQFNTVTRTEIYVNSNITFPTITLCNICPFSFRGKNSTDPLFRLLANMSTYSNVLPELIPDPSIEEFLRRTTKEIFDEYSMGLGLFYSTYNGEALNDDDFETLDTQTGRCYQFNGPVSLAKHGTRTSTETGRNSGLTVFVNIFQDDYGIVNDGSAGLRVYINHVRDFPRIKMDGIDIVPGTSTRLAIKSNEISFLPSPYKSYGAEGCVDVDGMGEELLHKMVNSTVYSFQICLDQCVAYRASMECSCYTPLLVLPGLRACSAYEFIHGCYHEASNRIAENASTFCDCPRPCSFISYDVILSSSKLPSTVALEHSMKVLNESNAEKIRNNYLEVRVYFDTPLTRIERHIPEFTVQSFLSSLGGHMGICLGASLISLAELGEVILQSALIGFRRLKNQFFPNRLSCQAMQHR